MPFKPAFKMPVTQSTRTLWFVYNRDRLLLKECENGSRIPCAEDLAQVNLAPIRSQYLGALDDRACFAAELPDEIQVLDGDKTKHGMGAVINETESPYHAYNGFGKWNAYDINFRAARFKDGKLTEKARVSMYFNGKKVHDHIQINKVWGGPNSGVDGGNDNGFGITDTPQGLKLQCEGHDVRYRNTWIKELNLRKVSTDFSE